MLYLNHNCYIQKINLIIKWSGECIIGCNDEEQNVKQLIHIMLEIEFNKPDLSDELNTTVNYDLLYSYTTLYIAKTKFQLLESLANNLAATIINNFPILSVKVSINKQDKSIIILQKYKIYKVAIAIGSNMHNPKQQIINSVVLMQGYLQNINIANMYSTYPDSNIKQDMFVNTCISADTCLSPSELITKIKVTEKQLHKIELMENGPRSIDIDILLYDNLIYNDYVLSIPHKRMHLRDFVLVPLNEIEPAWIHPVLNHTVSELLNTINRKLLIKQI